VPRALGEDHQHALVGQQALGVLGQPGEVPEAARELRRERHLVEELLRHALREPRRVHLEELRRDHHHPVDRDATGVVADEHHAPVLRHVLDAVGLDGEVVPEQVLHRGEPGPEVVLRDPVRIDAERVEGDLEPVEALFDLGIDGEAHVASVRRPVARAILVSCGASSSSQWR
jgi:hypothetical protein